MSNSKMAAIFESNWRDRFLNFLQQPDSEEHRKAVEKMVNDEKFENDKWEAEHTPEYLADQSIKIRVRPENRYDNFSRFDTENNDVRGKILAKAKDFASNLDPDTFALIGPCGRGKTLLAISIARVMLQNAYAENRKFNFCYITEYDIISKIRSSYNRNGETAIDIISKLSSADLLIIDEMGKSRSSDFSLCEIEEIAANRWMRNKTIFISNLSPVEFGKRYTDGFYNRINLKNVFGLTGTNHHGEENK